MHLKGPNLFLKEQINKKKPLLSGLIPYLVWWPDSRALNQEYTVKTEYKSDKSEQMEPGLQAMKLEAKAM